MFEELKKNAAALDADELLSVEHLRCGDRIKIVFRFEYPYFNVKLHIGDEVYRDAFNDKEPFDVLTHFFFIPEPQADTPMCLTLYDDSTDGDLFYHELQFGTPKYANEEDLLKMYDNGLTAQQTEEKQVVDGVVYKHILYKDKVGAPVHTFWLFVDTKKASLAVGTPNDGLQAHDVIATVPAMIDSAIANGKNVVAAVNADFFNMFGDGSPSGLCVKDGSVIANADSKRAFIGIKKDGSPVLTTLEEEPELLPQLQQAAAGLEMILKDGHLYEWGPLEPFAFTRHPRTAAGLCEDGTAVFLVVDGRIPDYSNGASLVDMALLLQSFGVKRAVNLDGGGSSVCYTKENGEFILHNNPADLVRPLDKIIREEFNCILVTTNQSK
ncbi:MAG: phosphodiester glycosidase family protein [Clostridia bacterium]|nr:phosphodiester glycosidase family protein [Clostridia bacterium]